MPLIMESTEKTVTILRSEYNNLMDAQKKMFALEAGGVDNWEGYGDSLREYGYFDDDEEEETKEN